MILQKNRSKFYQKKCPQNSFFKRWLFVLQENAETGFQRTGSPRTLDLSLSGPERLKATRGSHAPAVRHLSLHLSLCPSLIPAFRSFSLNRYAFRYTRRPARTPAIRVNRGRDAYSRRGSIRRIIFWPRGAVIYYTQSALTKVDLESVL